MSVGESKIGYVTVRVDMSELEHKVWMLEDCLARAQKLMEEIQKVELPVVANNVSGTEAE